MGLFRRGPRGRHALGAAVTSIPSGPARPARPVAAPVPPPAPVRPASEPSVMDCIAELIASGEAWASDGQDAHALNPPAAVRAPARPVRETSRVQLGFRDGTSTTLEPGSEQARALEELAQSLTRRD